MWISLLPKEKKKKKSDDEIWKSNVKVEIRKTHDIVSVTSKEKGKIIGKLKKRCL